MARVRLTTDEILKLKAVVLYVIKKCQSIDYFHLFKIIYFADREHYATYGRRIICDTFCALPKGPVPSFLYDAIKVLLNEDKTSKDLNIISNALSANDSVYKFILSAKEDPDMDELSLSDIKVLDKSIEENLQLSINVLSEKSHDLAWREAWNKSQNSPMKPILMAQAGGASDATLEYILENELFDKIVEA